MWFYTIIAGINFLYTTKVIKQYRVKNRLVEIVDLRREGSQGKIQPAYYTASVSAII